jgi:hypothetical protein
VVVTPTITLAAPPAVIFNTGAQTVNLTANVSANGAPVTTGTVTFTVAGQTVTAHVGSNGAVTAGVSLPAGLAAAGYPITASFSGTGFTNVSTTGTLTVSPAPTTLTITGVTDKFGLFNETEAVTAQVASPGGTVNRGSVTITDNGQTQTVGVANGQATATFTFSFFQELGAVLAHTVNANYSDTGGDLGSSGTSFQAKGNLFGFLFQLLLDRALIQAFSGSSMGGMMG